MSEPGTDQERKEQMTKEPLYRDKRLLVLFCFGLLLIGYDMWPYRFPPPAIRPFYIPSLRCVQVDRAPALPVSIPIHQQHILDHSSERSINKIPLFGGLRYDSRVPAELDLFLDRPLRINRAGESSLIMLPGIGPRLAGAIIAARHKHGLFNGPEDLLRVPGIGAARLQQLEPLVSFD